MNFSMSIIRSGRNQLKINSRLWRSMSLNDYSFSVLYKLCIILKINTFMFIINNYGINSRKRMWEFGQGEKLY